MAGGASVFILDALTQIACQTPRTDKSHAPCLQRSRAWTGGRRCRAGDWPRASAAATHRAVRKDIDHLSPKNRRHLEEAVQILRAKFDARLKSPKDERGHPRRICKIILYGSMARGEPVLDMVNGYKSDFDLLVIVSEPGVANPKYWEDAAQALLLAEEQDETRHPVSFIVHDLEDVTEQIRLGRPFFRDIVRDGIVIYEFSAAELPMPGNLSRDEELAEARKYYEQWFASSSEFSKFAAFGMSEGMLNKTAFQLHQAIEAAYHCALLTLTLYSAKEHDIEKLRKLAEAVEPRLIEAWPRKHYYERRPFNRLKRAYVEARYSPHFVITGEDLAFAAERVAVLQAIVKTVCEERLAAG
ncbi:HEPN domain-containing protein [Rhizorhabdus dicambivorans]|nr:HEPN domain-containing protein [Rhizorhabdus dicambivorans]